MNIGFVLFANLTQLDLTGPLEALSRVPGARIHIAAKTLAPVPSQAGLALVPTTTFADCPALDVICAPGGFGVEEAINDEETVAFVRRQAAGARYVTAVCTGAFLLGAAGLLRGKRATTHWAYHDALARVGAIPAKARVVRDGNIFTGGGVTAGIDFGLALAAEIAGDEAAQAIQLSLEYDPAPPFDAGDPDRAPAGVRALVDKRYAARAEVFAAALDRAMAAAG